MKFEFNWPRIVSEKICFNMLKGLQYEGPWQNGQP